MATVRSPSPAMGDPSRESHRSSKARPAPSSRGVRPYRSDESLGDILELTSRDDSRLNGSAGNLTNRQRVANLTSQLNGSGSSLVSDDSRTRSSSRHARPSSGRRRGARGTASVASGSSGSSRRPRSVSPDMEDGDETVASSSSKRNTSRKPRSNRNGLRNDSSRSRSRSKSRNPRSKSLNARNARRRHGPSRTTSEQVKPGRPTSSSRSQSPGPLELSPGVLKQRERTPRTSPSLRGTPKTSPSLRRGSVSSSTRLTRALPSAPLSAGSEVKRRSISELELIGFLREKADAEGQDIRGVMSVPSIMLDDDHKSGRRKERGSQRRERSTLGDSSSNDRPPRNARGVGRSQSASVTSGSKTIEAIISPRRPPTSRGVRRTTSGSDTKRKAPGRSRSTDDMGNLGNFFAKNVSVSRRKRPGYGSRSVASMPTGPRRPRGGSSVSEYGEAAKPPSSRSTVATATETYFSDEEGVEEDDSINESLEDLNDVTPMSASSMDSPHDFAAQSFSQLSMESALQMHMSRTENLLFEVFPKHIAEALRSGRKVEPENHECVTIFFSDIVGFTNISSELDPMKISDLLDRLYNSFDALSIYHDVFKVETIGDAYMAVTNLTKVQEDHCKRIAEFAIDAVRVANQTLIDKDDPSMGFVNIRVGFHSGPVVSNVVGSRNPRFCLFGDTVNTASRMESNSAQNRIHCSESSAELLKIQHPELKLNPRGLIEVKGKGQMKTFWVNEDAAFKSQRDGSSRSIFKLLKRSHQRATVK